jgi:hypothetical protein
VCLQVAGEPLFDEKRDDRFEVVLFVVHEGPHHGLRRGVAGELVVLAQDLAEAP